MLRRILHVLFISLTILSFIFCVFAAAAWDRSQVAYDAVRWVGMRGKWGIESSSGQVLIWRHQIVGAWNYGQNPHWTAYDFPVATLNDGPTGLQLRINFAGIHYRSGEALQVQHQYLLVNDTLAVGIFAILPIAWLVRRFLRKSPRAPGNTPPSVA